MPMPQPSWLQRVWQRWRSLNLPWRRQRLAGIDLAGNTFWEFKDALNAKRMRRIVKGAKWQHYGDVQLSPQWHQWLRHTREHPPSLAEQQADVLRQRQLRALAQRADERWAAQASYLDVPEQTAAPQPATLPRDSSGYGDLTEKSAEEKSAEQQSSRQRQHHGESQTTTQSPDNDLKSSPRPATHRKPAQGKQQSDSEPRKTAAIPHGPSETWQPEAWKPGTVRR